MNRANETGTITSAGTIHQGRLRAASAFHRVVARTPSTKKNRYSAIERQMGLPPVGTTSYAAATDRAAAGTSTAHVGHARVARAITT